MIGHLGYAPSFSFVSFTFNGVSVCSVWKVYSHVKTDVYLIRNTECSIQLFMAGNHKFYD